MVVAIGWSIQRFFGRRTLGDKLAARSTAGCLRLGSFGCGLWAFLSGCITLATGRIMLTGEPAGIPEVLIGMSGFFLVIVVVLAVAWFISANFTELSPAERLAAFQGYLRQIEPIAHKIGEPETHLFIEGKTLEVLDRLDAPLKRKLLDFLGEHDLLSGTTRVRLRKADFRGVDLRTIRLPRANLSEVDLRRANLANAHLFEVDLQMARLDGADLSRANLQDADLRRAVLTGALLDGAILTGARLEGAKVSREQLDRARPTNTNRPGG